MKKILLTGAAGRIGTSLRTILGHAYQFRCLDISPVEDEEDVIVASTLDFAALLKGMENVDAVVHLAGNPDPDQSWEDVYASSIGGTYNVFEAARRTGIKKVIYASTTHVHKWRGMQQGRSISADMPVHPVTLYGVGKATGEILACYFFEQYDISIVCIRIGWFHVDPPKPNSSQDDILKAWCSPQDLAQLVSRCLETEGLGFQVFFGISNNTQSLWDIRNAQDLVGYHPVSNAEDQDRPPDGHYQGKELLKRPCLVGTGRNPGKTRCIGKLAALA